MRHAKQERSMAEENKTKEQPRPLSPRQQRRRNEKLRKAVRRKRNARHG